MKYIMITDFIGYWNNMQKKQAYYPKNWLRGKMSEDKLKNNVATVFIKVNNKTDLKPERAWLGTISNIKKEDDKIYFDVNLTKALISVPQKYRGWKVGWGVDELDEREQTPEEMIMSEKIFYPPFFYDLKETTDYKKFESYTFYFLKLLGLQEIYKIDPRQQQGKPDGIFKLGGLTVIYDCTLDNDYCEKKKTQIKNFCAQMKDNHIEYARNEIDIANCKKQVWIITRGESREIIKIGDVIVYEVALNSLLNVYLKRLKDIGLFDLEKELTYIV